jgi:hypothetical protein
MNNHVKQHWPLKLSTVMVLFLSVLISACSDSDKAGQQAGGPIDEVVVYQPGSGDLQQADSGLRYQYFEANAGQLADLSLLVPRRVGIASAVGDVVGQRVSDYALVYNGYLQLPADGTYTLELVGQDATSVTLDGQVILSQADNLLSVELNLSKGFHSLNVSHVQLTGSALLELFISGVNLERQPIAASWLFYDRLERYGIVDSDDDGVVDTLDLFPLDPNESTDVDGDGVGDTADPDSFDIGLAYRYFEGDAQQLQDFSQLTSVKAGVSQGLDLSVRQRDGQYGLLFSGYLLVEQSREVSFDINTSAGGNNVAEVYLDDVLILQQSGQAGRAQTGQAGQAANRQVNQAVTLQLTAGYHQIRFKYVHISGAPQFEMFYQPTQVQGQPNVQRQPLPFGWLQHPEPVMPDADGDGVSDAKDPFPQDPLQWADADGDGIPDPLDNDQYRAGLYYRYAEGQTPINLPISQGQSADIDLTLRQRDNDYRLQFDGFINIPETARYTFDMTTNNGSQITIDGHVVLSEPASRTIGAQNAVDLIAGRQPIVLTYVHYSGVPQLDVYLKAPGLAHQKVTTAGGFISGLDYRYFEASQAQLADLSQLSLLTPVAQGAVADFDVTVAQRNSNFAIEFSGFLDISASKHYDFNISTDAQANSNTSVILNNNLLLSQPAVNVVNNQWSLDLIKGYHPFTATHSQVSGTAQLLLNVQAANLSPQPLPSSWYFNTEYLNTDTDGDGVPDVVDNFPNNPVEYADLDGDGIGDINDPDIDGDGVSNENDVFELDPTEWADLDNDGIGDNSDPDTDGDGVLNPDDVFPLDGSETLDMDGDGIGDNSDPDIDGDGVSNDADIFPNDPTESSDLDNDGIGDNSDPDIDGDGVLNAADVFPVDASESSDIDGDGIGDNSDPDRDGDGVSNDADSFPNDPTETSDMDGDGIGDNSDPDRDGDGVPNNADALPNDPTETADMDGDGIGDNSDPDRDGDGVANDGDVFPNDASESADLDGDGVGDNSDPDRDGDGVNNGDDAFPDNPNASSDIDGDGIEDNSDPDIDGDGVLNGDDALPYDGTETTDLDGDGVGDNSDPDTDGDGVLNSQDLFPLDVSEWADLDNDGIGDNGDTDRDGDGVDNTIDVFPDDATESSDLDGDGVGDHSDPDRDGDGVGNNSDAFPDDASESADLDGDGIGNNADTDRDGDGVANDVDALPDDPTESKDLDGDGIGDNSDPDRDGDGVANGSDAFPDDVAENNDLDGDGIGDNADTDRDGDGVNNDTDLFPNDASETVDMDGDGIGDNSDPDKDGDGVTNANDAFPEDASESADIDGDGIGDNSDPDRDGDGYLNDNDAFPNDPMEWLDTDGDGVGDNASSDKDGDGYFDNVDVFPLDPTEWFDLDRDGIGDNRDPDKDGDGVNNAADLFPDDGTEWSDIDGDGIGDNADTDRDGDGVLNVDDAFPADASESADLDGDGIGDNADTDRDGDGVNNDSDVFPDNAAESADLDGDGIGDNADTDRDGDGTNNSDDAFPDDGSETADFDGDGIGDNADTDIDGDGVANDADFYPNDISRHALESVTQVTTLLAGVNGEQVVINWQSVNAAGHQVANYRILRATPTGPFAAIGSLVWQDNQFIDTSVSNGQGYRYQVQSVTAAGKVGDTAPQVQIYVAYNHDLASQLSNPQLSPDGNQIDDHIPLSWLVEEQSNIPQFVVLRGSDIGQLSEYTRVSTSAFIDRGVTLGQVYHYQIFSQRDFVNPFSGDAFSLNGPLSAMVTVYFAPKLLITLDGLTADENHLYRLVLDSDNSALAITGQHANVVAGAGESLVVTAFNGSDTVSVNAPVSGVFSLSLPIASQAAQATGATEIQWLITSVASNNLGQQQGRVTLNVELDKAPPVLTLEGGSHIITPTSTITLTGSVSDDIEVVSVSGFVSVPEGAPSAQVFSAVIDQQNQFSLVVPVVLGLNDVTITATDKVGKQATKTITVERDQTLVPQLSLASPAGDVVVAQSPLSISGFITTGQSVEALTVTLNEVQVGVLSKSANGNNDQYQFDFADVQLGLGQNPMSIKVTSAMGDSQLNFIVTYQDVVPPQLGLNQAGPFQTNSDSLRFSGTISDDHAIGSVTVVSSKAPTQVLNAVIQSNTGNTANNSAEFTVSVPLKAGENKLTFSGKDSSGNETKAYLTVNQINTSKPLLTLSEPQNGAQVSEPTVTVSGFVATDQPITDLVVTLEGLVPSTLVASQTNRYQFSFNDVPLELGVNALVLAVDSPKGRDSEIVNLFFIDSQPPVLVLSSPSSQSTELSSISIEGQVTDNHLVADITALSSQYVGQTFGVTIDPQGQFESQVPLKIGANQITLVAKDKADNVTQVLLTVNKIDTLTPQIAITSPSDGATVTRQYIEVVGTITSALPQAQLNVQLSGASLTELRAIAVNTWQFTFDSVGLELGHNSIPIEVHYGEESVNGTQGISYAQVSVHYDDGFTAQGPQIAISSPPPDSSISEADFTVQGTVSADNPLVSLTINGESVHLIGASTVVNFNYPVSFAANSNTLDLVMVATDETQLVSSQTFSYSRDATGPVISIDNALAATPTVNTVIDNPYHVSGRVTDLALSSVFINGQSIQVSPGNEENSYDFAVNLPLVKGDTYDLVISAFDQAGNQSSQIYHLLANAAATIDIIAPSGNTDFLSDGSTLDLSILARVKGLADGDSVRAKVDSQTPVPLEIIATLINTTVPMAASSGEHQLTLEVVDINGVTITTSSQSFNIVNSADIALSMRTEPSNGETGVEPHGFIGLYFNKPVDISKLEVEVRETSHGLIWINDDPRGTDFTQSKGTQLTSVSRDNALVAGELSVLPGDNVVAFYPAADLAYGAKVQVDIRYDGQSLSRYSYQVRDLPTFIEGVVMDQLGQPVSGVEVSLPALDRITVTADNGIFSFGYGDEASQSLTGGQFELVTNADMTTPGFGVDIRSVIIEQGRRNQLGVTRLVLNVETPFQGLASGQANAVLANGELVLDLTAAQLSFADGNNSGNVHVSFLNPQDTNLDYMQATPPNWLYGLQPAGIKVSGYVGVQIKMPELFGSMAYAPENGRYVVLLGKDANSNTLVPVGVGQIDNYIVKSVGNLALTRLDYLAYAIIAEQSQPLLAEYADGQRSLASLIGALQANN